MGEGSDHPEGIANGHECELSRTNDDDIYDHGEHIWLKVADDTLRRLSFVQTMAPALDQDVLQTTLLEAITNLVADPIPNIRFK